MDKSPEAQYQEIEWPDPEWTEYDLALVLAWIDYLEEKGIDIYLNRCNSEYTSH